MTPAPALDISFLVFSVIYVALAVATTIFLLRLRRGEHDLSPEPRAIPEEERDTVALADGHDQHAFRGQDNTPGHTPGSAREQKAHTTSGGA